MQNKLMANLCFLLFFSREAYAGEAIVIVLQAPLLKEEKYDSKVLQYVRKGERVYVPNEIVKAQKSPEFIPTFNRAGESVFVPAKYLKMITNDENEYLTHIDYGEYDPTDYRIEEPLSKTYPFSDNSYLRASVSFTFGNNVKSPYDYQKSFISQDYANEKGMRMLVTKKVSFDRYDRFYFGAIFNIASTKNFFVFGEEDAASESRSIIRVGPFISYDPFSGRNLRLTLGTGFTYNYHKTSIERVSTYYGEKVFEERFFSTYSLSPLISTFLQVENYFPGFDFVLGTDFILYLDKNLTANNAAVVPSLWPSETLREELKPQANLYMGVQFKY